MTLNNDFPFLALTGLYEPSAIQQLADGRFLVAEDEKQHPFSLVTISPDERVSTAPLSPGSSPSGDGSWKLDDLEGLALDQTGYVYAIASHPGLRGFQHAQGVSSALIDGKQRIIIVSDDGSREAGRYAQFLLLDPAQLQMAP